MKQTYRLRTLIIVTSIVTILICAIVNGVSLWKNSNYPILKKQLAHADGFILEKTDGPSVASSDKAIVEEAKKWIFEFSDDFKYDPYFGTFIPNYTMRFSFPEGYAVSFELFAGHRDDREKKLKEAGTESLDALVTRIKAGENENKGSSENNEETGTGPVSDSKP